MHVRVFRGDDIAFGPGKAELLTAVDELGSLAAAARQLGMSYMRAWELIQTMNRCFTKPLVLVSRGGRTGGRSELTPLGRKILLLYREINSQALDALAPPWKRLSAYLKR